MTMTTSPADVHTDQAVDRYASVTSDFVHDYLQKIRNTPVLSHSVVVEYYRSVEVGVLAKERLEKSPDLRTHDRSVAARHRKVCPSTAVRAGRQTCSQPQPGISQIEHDTNRSPPRRVALAHHAQASQPSSKAPRPPMTAIHGGAVGKTAIRKPT